MSPQVRKNLIRNIEARVIPLTIVALMIFVSATTVFVIQPGSDNIVSAATVDQFVSSKDIVIDHTQVNTSLTNWIMFLDITDADLASDALDSGYDIAFFDSDDNQLSHEIEYFDGNTGELHCWINTSVVSGSVDTTIYMYYDDSDIGSSAEDVTGTWGTEYYRVYHMNDLDAGADDALSGVDLGELVAMETDDYQQDGPCGNATKFDGEGSSSSECVGTTTNLMEVAEWEEDWTVEYWAKHSDSSVQTSQYALSFGDTCALFMRYLGGTYAFYANDEADSNPTTLVSITLDTNTFYYFVQRHDASDSNVSCFINGSFVGGRSQTNFHNGAGSDSVISASYSTHVYGMGGGAIDEVRISQKAHNSSWFLTNYNNINNATDGGFYTVGAASAPVSGTYEMKLINSSGTTMTWEGEAGDTVWANATGTNNETLVIYANASGTSDNCSDIYIDLTDFDADLVQENISVEVRNTSDGTFDGTTTVIPAADGNLTLNSSVWGSASWCQGSNPFPIINSNCTIEVRMKIAIDDNAATGTKTNSGDWYVIWKVLT